MPRESWSFRLARTSVNSFMEELMSSKRIYKRLKNSQCWNWRSNIRCIKKIQWLSLSIDMTIRRSSKLKWNSWKNARSLKDQSHQCKMAQVTPRSNSITKPMTLGLKQGSTITHLRCSKWSRSSMNSKDNNLMRDYNITKKREESRPYQRLPKKSEWCSKLRCLTSCLLTSWLRDSSKAQRDMDSSYLKRKLDNNCWVWPKFCLIYS
jgi:hypothetical protein